MWIKASGTRSKVGAPAFTSTTAKGYYSGSLHGKVYRAHRVVYYLTHGDWPATVDHINGDVKDNSVHNLRSVSLSGNQQNSVRRGYCWHKGKGKYIARITLNGKHMLLGYFTTEEDARQAYLDAKRLLHNEASERVLV